MKILHTVEYYHPSLGGAQEVVRQVSEFLAAHGHDITVATTRLNNRKNRIINGVKIEEFDISGNAVEGMQGEIDRYQRFLLEGKFDIMMNYAAQQWTMDAAFPILDRIPYKKVMVPCGFSNLFNPKYSVYFQNIPKAMKQYDQLIFHTSHYRDIDFAHKHGIDHYSLIPNGASQSEFSSPDLTFRQRNNIPNDVPMLLTVGSHTGMKGHQLVLEAFRQLQTKNGVLVIIGNMVESVNLWQCFLRPLLGTISKGKVHQAAQLILRTTFGGIGPGCIPDCKMRSSLINIAAKGQKRVILLDPPRKEVVAALHAADLFVFGSNIEYSPLVLFEAMAASTPFLSLACGNAAEIASWGGGGVIAPTIQKENGMAEGDPSEFAIAIDDLLQNGTERLNLAKTGHSAWLKQFTWEKIAPQYEKLYQEILL